MQRAAFGYYFPRPEYKFPPVLEGGVYKIASGTVKNTVYPRGKTEVFTNLGIYIPYPDSVVARLAEDLARTRALLAPNVIVGTNSDKELSFRIYNFSDEVVVIEPGYRFLELQFVRSAQPHPHLMQKPTKPGCYGHACEIKTAPPEGQDEYSNVPQDAATQTA